MKYIKLSILTLTILFTGCLNNSGNDYDDSEDQAFLEEYAQRNGVTETTSGLMYRVIEEGDGEMPDSDQNSIITYDGESVRGDVQYSTGQGYEIIVPDQLPTFPGIGEGVQLMKEGGRYEFVIPSELAQDDGRTFIFEITLQSFLRENQQQFLIDNAELEDIEVTESGLQYRILEEGDGEEPRPTSTVRVKYKGTYTNGFVFDQSPDGDGVDFNVSGVIAGFSEGLLLMSEGSKYELFIPPELGYGAQAPQFNTVLQFEVELVEVF